MYSSGFIITTKSNSAMQHARTYFNDIKKLQKTSRENYTNEGKKRMSVGEMKSVIQRIKDKYQDDNKRLRNVAIIIASASFVAMYFYIAFVF